MNGQSSLTLPRRLAFDGVAEPGHNGNSGAIAAQQLVKRQLELEQTVTQLGELLHALQDQQRARESALPASSSPASVNTPTAPEARPTPKRVTVPSLTAFFAD